jgi:hypothetical protein
MIFFPVNPSSVLSAESVLALRRAMLDPKLGLNFIEVDGDVHYSTYEADGVSRKSLDILTIRDMRGPDVIPGSPAG